MYKYRKENQKMCDGQTKRFVRKTLMDYWACERFQKHFKKEEMILANQNF